MLISRLLMRKAVLALGFKPWSAFCSRRHKEGEELVARYSLLHAASVGRNTSPMCSSWSTRGAAS